MNNIWNKLPKPIFVLAPMDDVTDTVFRQIIADCAPPDLYFTEFVNVDGLQSVGREKLVHKLRYTAKEKPIIAQVWGKNPDNYFKTTKDLIEMGFDGVDINMGCPVKAVVKDGCCVALVDDRILASEIITQTQKAAKGKIPVSVKTRIGNRSVDMNWIEFLLSHNLEALTVHGRTGKQMSKVPADWDKIGEARELRDRLSPATKIIGNGDVMSRAEGLKLADKYNLDGVMIGRGIFQDPFVFANSLSSESPWQDYSKEQKIKLYKKHVQLFAKTWNVYLPGDLHLSRVQGGNEKRASRTNRTASESRKLSTQKSTKSRGGILGFAKNQNTAMRNIRGLNKFCKIYINGFDGAKEMRVELMNAKTTDELLEKLSSI